jgi:hypothetical protein
MKKLIYIPALLLLLASFSCEDVVEIDAKIEEPQLVVDAWLNQLDTTQTVLLSLTQDYFNNAAPQGVTAATVILINETQGKALPFTHQDNGAYTWTPQPGEQIGTTGDVYTLAVSYQNWNYEASSQLKPVPPVDSIVYEFREAELGNPEGIFAQFYAIDLPGIGDTYWIKTYKNGEFLNKPSEMNLSADGTFDQGSGTDGIVFITPIREAINRITDDSDSEDNSEVPPYAVGDHIRVEIHSLTNPAFRFLSIARDQITNGSNGIFALPVANSPTNIVGVEAEAPAAVGFFNIATVTSLEVVVE